MCKISSKDIFLFPNAKFFFEAQGKIGSHVPGVTVQDKGNLRPKIKGGRVKEVKAGVPLEQPELEEGKEGEEDDDLHDTKTVTSAAASEVTVLTRGTKSAIF